MRKKLTLMFVALLSLAAFAMTQAARRSAATYQMIKFSDANGNNIALQETFSNGDFSLTRVDTKGKNAIDGNTAWFGDATNYKRFTARLKSGGKTQSNGDNSLVLTIPAQGMLNVYVRTGSSSATDRNLILTQNGSTLYNEIVEEANAIDVDMGGNAVKVYPVISVPVSAGDVTASYPVNGLNFYGFEFVPVLWSSERPVACSWAGEIQIAADKLANVKVGDKIHVAVEGVTPAGEWDAMVALYDGNWTEIEQGVAVGLGDKDDVAFTVTGDIKRLIQANGLMISGTGFSSKMVTLESCGDEPLGSDNSIFVGSHNVQLPLNINHFKNANGKTGVAVGDILRVTCTATDPQWFVLSDGEWTDVEGAAFTDIEGGKEYIFTAETAEIANTKSLIINQNGYTITQVELVPAPQAVDVTLAATDITDGDITAAITAAANGAALKSVNLTLAEGDYTVSEPIVAGGNVTINGNGATIDASALTGNFIQMAVMENPTEWIAADVTIKDVTVKGLKKALFYSACKNYVAENFLVDNCVVELAADATTFDYTKGSTAVNFTVTNSTFYAPTATTKSFYSSQSGQKTTEYDGNAVQTFKFENNTMYNLAPGKNFFSHRQSNQKWMTYNVQNNIFVNCGKSGQVIKGMNGGQSGSNPTWSIDGNVFNFEVEGVMTDTSAAEDTGDTTEGEGVQNSIAGVITFTDAAGGDFNGNFALAEGAAAPAGTVGDPRWTVSFAEPTVDVTLAATDITDGDITAAITAAANGVKVKDVNLTLAEGDYTVSEPIVAGGNVTITGAGEGTTIDASALSGAFIKLDGTDAQALNADGTENANYKSVENVTVKNVVIKGLTQPLVRDEQKTLVGKILVDNSIIELSGSKNVFDFNSKGYPADLTINNSTLWSAAGHTGYLLQTSGRVRDLDSDQASFKQAVTITNSTLYQVSVGKQFNNLQGKGQKSLAFTMKKVIMFNCTQDGNEVRGWLGGQNSNNPTVEYNQNAYWNNGQDQAGWTDSGKQGYDASGTAITGDPLFADAASGDFTLGEAGYSNQLKARIGDPRWLGTYKPAGFTAPIEMQPLDGADLYADLEEAYTLSESPTYITITLRPGAHYTVSQPLEINSTITITGDAENPATVDLSQLNGPMVKYSDTKLPALDADANGFYSYPYNVIFENTIFSQVKNQLFYANKMKYIIDYFTFDNCIAEYMGGSKTVFDFNSGGVVEHFTINNSTIYGKEQHTGSLFSSQSGQKIIETGRAMQYFTITNSTLYNIAYKKNVMTHRQPNQTHLSYTVKNNVVLDCGKQNQFVKGLNQGQGGKNPTWMVQYNSFMFTVEGKLTDNTGETTGDQFEEVSASYTNTYPEEVVTDIFPKWYITDELGYYTDMFRGNFTVAEGSVQKTNSVGDPRWLKSDNEYTGIKAVNAEKAAAEGDWYTVNGVRVAQPTKKGLYIHNGRKVVVK